MSKIDVQMTILPDIEMYGGDTTPWYIQLMHGSGIGFTYSEAAGYSSRLTITPFAYLASGYAVQKTGTISSYNGNGAAAVFSFTENDTKALSGKFIYQVEFINGSNKRIGQGTLFIRKNIV